MTEWADGWAAWARRFNTHHGPAGSGHGGQFVSAGGTAAGSKGKAGKPSGHAAPARPSSGSHAAERQALVTKIHADETQIATLERELHLQRQALKSSASQAAHHKAQAAASKKAGHVATHKHHVTKHATHHRHAVSHRTRIAELEHRLGVLRAQVKAYRGQLAKL